MKKIISSSGTARKNSTTAPAGTRTHQWSESRPTANTMPNVRDSTMATSAALSVCIRPGRMKLTQVFDSRNGFQSSGAHWPFASNLV